MGHISHWAGLWPSKMCLNGTAFFQGLLFLLAQEAGPSLS